MSIFRSVGFVCGLCLALSSSGVWAAQKMKTPWSFWYSGRFDKANFSHQLLDGVLRKHVRGGGVDYQSLSKRSRAKLDEYLFRIARTKASEIKGKRARFAFWINVYNALTLRAVLDRLPSSLAAQRSFSVLKVKGGFWKGFSYEVGGRFVTLDQIEHQILRPKYVDPRLHFAVVCASKGCPDLQGRAFTAAKLDRMLDNGVKRYLADARAFQLDRAAKTVKISKIFQWFKGDFSKGGYKGVLDFVARHVGDKATAKFLKENMGSMKIAYLPYSWKLNLR